MGVGMRFLKYQGSAGTTSEHPQARPGSPSVIRFYASQAWPNTSLLVGSSRDDALKVGHIYTVGVHSI